MKETVLISSDDRIAMAEVDYIIHHMNILYLNKIPQKIQDCITLLKKDNIKIYVDPKIPLHKQGLREYTLYFLMILNLKYWCNDERRRDILALLDKNKNAYDEKVNQIFEQAENIKTVSGEYVDTSRPKQVITVDNSVKEKDFEKNKENAQEESKEDKKTKEVEENAIAEKPKENFFGKLINKIKSVFKSKNK